MKDKLSKDGNKIIVTEYEVRILDQYGDCDDVNHFDNLKSARGFAAQEIKNSIAIVIEKHVSKFPFFCFDEPNVYTIIETMGDKEALEAGEWIKK